MTDANDTEYMAPVRLLQALVAIYSMYVNTTNKHIH